MKIAVTGSTGFIGTTLVSWLAQHEYTITRLVRTPDFHDYRYPFIVWNPKKKEIDAEELENHDAVIHLAGENIAKGRWTPKQKQEIFESRVKGTAFLCETLASLSNPPKTLLSASAAGFYGTRSPEERLTEESSAGTGFLSSVAQAWEKATEAAETAGIRVVHLRIGVVLGTRGGMLSRILPLFKIGLGGKIGSGKQIMSWVAIDEIPRMIHHILTHESISGPVNVTSPEPVSNKDFTLLLGSALNRPTFFAVPAFVLRFLMGEIAEELLLGGAAVLPRKLQLSGYHFLYPRLEDAFHHIFSQPY